MAKKQPSTPGTEQPADPFKVLRPRLVKALGGLSADLPSDFRERDLENRARPERTQFPVPELILFALRNVLGFRWSGHEEKVRWSVYGTFLGVPVSFEMRKFGFTICVAKKREVDIKRLCGQLQVAVKHVEDALEPIAKSQAGKGNVTVANRHYEFDDRYRFYRNRADRSYREADKTSAEKAKKKPASKDDVAPVFGEMVAGWNKSMRARRRGFYYSVAMVDAFFSRLEHTLVLLRAFSGASMEEGGLTAFLGMSWDDKLKALVDVDEPSMQKIYSDLKRIKERVRNPFAHGGVENDGGSLYVHIPTVGAMPANFTQIRDSVRFNFIPVDQDDHGSACEVFDRLEEMLKAGTLAGAHTFIEHGVDPSFAASQLATYKKLAEGPADAREAWCDHWNHERDRHDNMDY